MPTVAQVSKAIDPAELLLEATTWTVPRGVRPERAVEVPAGGVAFMLCGVPVVVRPGAARAAEVHLTHERLTYPDGVLDAEISARIFGRDPSVLCVVVHRPEVSA